MIVIWFISLFLSLAYVTWHNLTRNPVSWVQKLAWILVTAYTGVVGLAAYYLTCRKSKGMGHTASTSQTWQQAVNSEMHCVAGDATGIIFSAAIVYHFALPNGLDLLIEYISAFVVGLFLFQALMMLPMYRGKYLLAVRKTFFVEAVSMNFIMAGMIPVMVLMMAYIPSADSPYHPHFWLTMGLATMVGAVIAYPVNYWFVAAGLKHGCMTLGEEMSHGMKEDHSGAAMAKHQRSLSLSAQIGAIAASCLLLIAVVALTSRVVPIHLF